MPTVPTFAVRQTDVSRHNGGTSGVLLKPLRDDNALRTLSSLRGLRGAPEFPPLCRETSVCRTANVGTVGMNGLIIAYTKDDYAWAKRMKFLFTVIYGSSRQHSNSSKTFNLHSSLQFVSQLKFGVDIFYSLEIMRSSAT